MSDYTPTTEDIEHVWVSRTNGEHSWASLEETWEMQAEFGRWRELNDVEIARRQRERIIARLKQYHEDLYDDANRAAESGGDPAWDIERAEAVETCIALIKGENE